jgi:hypothetical protein
MVAALFNQLPTGCNAFCEGIVVAISLFVTSLLVTNAGNLFGNLLTNLVTFVDLSWHHIHAITA